MLVKLKELLTIKNGRDRKHLDKGNIPVIGTGGIMTYVDEFLYDKEAILLPRKGSLNNVMYINKPFRTVDTMFYAIPNIEKVNGKFLYYYLSLMNFERYDLGSTIPSMTAGLYYTFEVNIPERKIQDKIADLLTKIDNQIERNNRMVQSLQVLAQSTYSRWFNQFEFPHENGKSYKSDGGKMVYNEELKKEIPEGWKVDNLGSLIIEKEKSKIKAGDAVDGDYPFFTSGDEILTYNSSLINGKNCYLNTGGNAGIKYFSRDCSYSTDTWCITSNQNYEEFLYLYLNSIIEIINKNYFAGSGLKHLQKESLKNIRIIIPDETTMAKFSNVVSSMFDFISCNYFETKRLENLKNTLLPLLINGQLS